MRKARRRGIFCLEGTWSRSLKKQSSVEPILQLLRQWDPVFVRFVHRDVDTGGSLRYYLDKWTKNSYADYPILYLAFHGEQGTLCIGDQRRRDGQVRLEDLERMLAGKCGKRIIYFAACATVGIHGNRLNAFLRKTGALAVCGYTADVDWLVATAFELLVFAAMQENALSKSGARAMKRRIYDASPQLAKRLGFRMVVKQ